MMNLLNNNWLKFKNKNIRIKREKESLIIENNTNSHAFVLLPKLMKKRKKDIKGVFNGKIIKGEAAVLMMLNRKKEILSEASLNSEFIVSNKLFKYYLLTIKVFANTTVKIDKLTLSEEDNAEANMFESFTNDTLVITPSYPSEEHKYLSGFVHSRIKAYKENDISVDVAVVYDYKNIDKYVFEDIEVTRMSYFNLRNLLQTRKYKKILIHFFDVNYFNVLQGCDLEDTEIFIWVHGPETLHWDYPLFVTKYFESYQSISQEQADEFKRKDEIIKHCNNMTNVKWIFVSNWIKERSEQLIGIKFNNYEVIPNIIDTNMFDFRKKNQKQRKKIFMLRRYDNINKYAVDVSVRTILELSKRKIFDELEFNIYGKGDYFNELFEPIKDFKNVHFYSKFLTHEDISNVHKENGIALFPTRYDAQGVSMCEAGSSGLLVVSSENDAIKEFIPFEDGNIIDTENYVKYADFIENIVNDENKFNKITKETRNKIEKLCSYKATVNREIDLIKTSKLKKTKIKKAELSENPILSVIIPSYNVSQYISKTLKTLISCNNSNLVELLVVNDGSKDNTSEVVSDFIKKYCSDNKPVVRLIDKENGGHGSTINVGIEKAKGKYVRIIDGDDWVNTEDFDKLINILSKEESDIVVTNYSEDRYSDNEVNLIKKELYSCMVPGMQYDFDSICNYGLKQWGPILATANIKTEKLREANFKLSEKTFYVDMEFNSFYLPVIKNMVYYDLDIYRYFIGRPNQSISLSSFIRNIDHHERVITNILKFCKENELSEEKKKYLNKNIIDPMIIAHYNLLLNTIRDRKKFNSFDNILKEYLSSEKYHAFSKRIKMLRKTKGLFIKTLYVFSNIGGKK